MTRTQFGPFVQYQHSISSIKQPNNHKKSVFDGMTTSRETRGRTFPPCDGGRKFREFTTILFFSTIVYNQATEIKVFPSDCKIKLSQFGYQIRPLIKFSWFVKNLFSMLNWRVFVRREIFHSTNESQGEEVHPKLGPYVLRAS